jgi:hypothetical protein
MFFLCGDYALPVGRKDRMRITPSTERNIVRRRQEKNRLPRYKIQTQSIAKGVCIGDQIGEAVTAITFS